MKKIIKYCFQIILVIAIAFQSGALAYYYINADEIEYKEGISVQQELNYIYTNKDILKDLNLSYINSSFTFDANRAKINYTADKNEVLLVVGVGTSTRYIGNSYTSVNTTGNVNKIVDGTKKTILNNCYFTTFVYQISLSEGETLDFQLWSNQGNTSNVAMLFSIG